MAGVLVLGLLALAGCSGSTSEGASPQRPDAARVAWERPPDRLPALGPERRELAAAALGRGVAYLADHLDEIDPSSLGMIDYFHRNWEVEALAGAERAAARAPDPDDPEVAVLLRLGRPADDRLPEVDDATRESFAYRVMARALYCDDAALPDRWAADAERAAQGTPVERSHVGYAVVWVRELGCSSDGLDRLQAQVVDVLEGDLAAATVADDETLALGASLAYLGRSEVLDDRWVAAVLDAQHEDGGWGIEP